MNVVMVESPFASAEYSRDDCVRYAQFCVRDSLARGECPFALWLQGVRPQGTLVLRVGA